MAGAFRTTDSKSVLIPYPRLSTAGGGNSVTAWILTALIENGWDVTLASLHAPDFAGVDAFFGTRLRAAPPKVCLTPQAWRTLFRLLPTPGAFLEMALMERFAGQLHRERGYDLYFSTNNEMCLPRPGLQYIHFPRHCLQRPPDDYRWHHRLPALMPVYRSLAQWVAGPNLCPWRDNLALANSGFIANLYRKCGGGEAEVVHPPVAGAFPDVEWSNRRDRVIALGRIHRSKRVLEMIEIVKRVRERGHDLEFWILGAFDCDESHRGAIISECSDSSWLRVIENLDRGGLIDLLSHSRYGLHAMEEEHFGMGIAEMREAGMIVLAPNSGGPPEILTHDPRVLFESMDGAVEKLSAVLGDTQLRNDLLEGVAKNRGRFSSSSFVSQVARLAAAMA